MIRRHTRGSDDAIDGFMDWLCTYDDGGSVWSDYPETGKAAIRANGPAIWAEFAKPDKLRRSQLAALKMPTLVAAGERTQPWFRKAGRDLARRIPSAQYRPILDANHALADTAPGATANIIREAAAIASSESSVGAPASS